MFCEGELSITKDDVLNKTTEAAILAYYVGITKIPIKINSPFRVDKIPSLGFYYKNGKLLWTDFSNNSGGDVFSFLEKLWNTTLAEVIARIYKDLPKFTSTPSVREAYKVTYNTQTTPKAIVQCKTRDWKDYDLAYWESFGITLPWLKFADVYPVSHILVTKENKNFTVPADKYAYAYVEFKEGNTTLKIYQPFNTKGYKWINQHDKSVVSLWTKVPKNGSKVCICSSLKDALCLWSNTGIPSIAVQGEGYRMSDTAIHELYKRFKHVYICFDNDEPGIIDGQKLSKLTGFTNIVLPQFAGGKDISDYFRVLNSPDTFKQNILKLFNL